MTMRIAAIAAAASLGFAAASGPAFADSPFVGVWAAEADGQAPDAPPHFEGSFTVTETGEGYAIAYVDTFPEPPADLPPPGDVHDIMVEGDTFSFKRTLMSPEGPFVVRYQGVIAGDAFTGTVSAPDVPELGVYSYTGRRR